MTHAGYKWTIRPVADAWTWAIFDPEGGQAVLGGEAPSRPVAAALVIRAIARGVTADRSSAERIAA